MKFRQNGPRRSAFRQFIIASVLAMLNGHDKRKKPRHRRLEAAIEAVALLGMNKYRTAAGG